MTAKTVTVNGPQGQNVTFSNAQALSIISGPCAIESRDCVMQAAETLSTLCRQRGMGYVFKSSFDKANRTSISGKRGVGMDEGLKILEEVRNEFGVPVLTDVHESHQVAAVAEVVDVVQIPAFLCRQTDLLLACGNSGKAINVKKAQFMAPHTMQEVAAKIASTGNENIMLCERGSCLGYGDLVVDYRGLHTMAESSYPVIFDASHSVMQMSGKGNASGGSREFIPALTRAAVAVGVAGVFMESHPDPTQAISDKETQVPLADMPAMLDMMQRYDQVRKEDTLAQAA